MEKVGLIAKVFTDEIRKICERLELLSDGQLRIGYCYSLEAIEKGGDHPDFVWAANRGADLPDRLQEVLRNCDLLLPVQSENEDVSTLPLMTAKGTFVIKNGVSEQKIAELKATAEEYGTKIGSGEINDNNIAEQIVKFYRGE